MRVDVVTIFPDYLTPLTLSLVGKARERGLLDVRVHDLRDFTDDVHRSVDDTPYGGGPGMVMRPEPWGSALDAITADADQLPLLPLLIVPTPAGVPFTQARAEEYAKEPWLAFACGRYEGIDHRVVDDARRRMRVEELSIGDYVLGGGKRLPSSSSKRLSGCCPVSWATPNRWSRSRTRQGFSRVRRTPSRRPGAGSTSRPS